MLSWIASSPIAYPALEVLHITGISMPVGNLVLFELWSWASAPSCRSRRWRGSR